MSSEGRSYSATRRNARIAAAPYQVHQYALQDSTSSEDATRLRNQNPIQSDSSLGSWTLAAQSGTLSPASTLSAHNRGGYDADVDMNRSQQLASPQLHLHRHATHAQVNVDASQQAQYNEYNQQNNMLYQQQNMLVQTADPEVVNQAWHAVAAARGESAHMRLEATEYVANVETRAQTYVESVVSESRSREQLGEQRIHNMQEQAALRERSLESEAERRHSQALLDVERERAQERERIRELERALTEAMNRLQSQPPPTQTPPPEEPPPPRPMTPPHLFDPVAGGSAPLLTRSPVEHNATARVQIELDHASVASGRTHMSDASHYEEVGSTHH